MNLTVPADRLESAYQTALAALLNERTPEGHWVGELATSALSTATAVMALHLVQKNSPGRRDHDHLIQGGLDWLSKNQNADGGWGDTIKSFSNISTTMLCRAAFYLTGAASRFALAVNRAETWLFSNYGSTPEQLAEAVRARYGKDRTFATPILTTCALAGLVPWQEVPPLPFELAIFPQSWFRFLKLHVVSYALPALIAIGQCIYHYRKPRNPLTRMVRWLCCGRTDKVLERIQPASGGFLEAIPLTSFVTLSRAACGLREDPVARKGVEFLVNAVRPDGSWAIDSNLATWVTTLALGALSCAGELRNLDKKDHIKIWLYRQSGWAWTDLPGGVPDADDTSGAVLAIRELIKNPSKGVSYAQLTGAALGGLFWLKGTQNSDGGWPTFCRGWKDLPFDRSGADLTAHALRALVAWGQVFDQASGPAWKRYEDYFDDLMAPGLAYLTRRQRPDGSWLPLWFGNQHAPDDENPTYGTARVLAAYRDLAMMNEEPAQRGVAWLLSVQNADGGWGGAKHTPSSMEETALAVEILLDTPDAFSGEPQATAGPVATAVNNGLAWLVEQVEKGGLYNPAPIGFYFAKLWYYEKLYPIIFTVAALGRARRKLQLPAL